MTPLEEKIETFIKKWKKDNSYDTCGDETCGCHQENIDFKIDIQSIATQAVEEERQRILDEFPEENNLDECLGDDCRLSCEGYNDALSQVRNIISKPNI